MMIDYLDSKLRSENKPSSVHPFFTALPYAMPKKQRQTKSSVRNKQESKVQCIHRKTWYSLFKMEGILVNLTWASLKDIVLSNKARYKFTWTLLFHLHDMSKTVNL